MQNKLELSYPSNDYNAEAWNNKMTIDCGEELNLAYRKLIKQRLSLLILQISGGN